MKATNQARKIPVLMEAANNLLTPADLLRLERLAQLKAELKKLEEDLKPRIEATVKANGPGVVQIGSRQVKLAESVRQSYSWKSIAYAVAEEEAINAVKDDFAVEYTSYSARVVS